MGYLVNRYIEKIACTMEKVADIEDYFLYKSPGYDIISDPSKPLAERRRALIGNINKAIKEEEHEVSKAQNEYIKRKKSGTLLETGKEHRERMFPYRVGLGLLAANAGLVGGGLGAVAGTLPKLFVKKWRGRPTGIIGAAIGGAAGAIGPFVGLWSRLHALSKRRDIEPPSRDTFDELREIRKSVKKGNNYWLE